MKNKQKKLIPKHGAGDILKTIRGTINKSIGILDMLAPKSIGDPRSPNQNRYIENRGSNIYKMHKVGTFYSPECAVYVNRLLRHNPGGNAWSHTYTKPYINGYDGIKEQPRTGSRYQNHFSYNLDAADNLKKKFKKEMLDPNQVYVVNMYYKGSPWDYKSRNEGNSYSQGTHTGILINKGSK